MITHPTSTELLDAVIRFLEERVAPQMKDRDAFLTRVAVNALATVRREGEAAAVLETSERDRLSGLLSREGSVETLTSILCAAIREGHIPDDDPALLQALKASAMARVRIDQPNYSGLKQALG